MTKDKFGDSAKPSAHKDGDTGDKAGGNVTMMAPRPAPPAPAGPRPPAPKPPFGMSAIIMPVATKLRILPTVVPAEQPKESKDS